MSASPWRRPKHGQETALIVNPQPTRQGALQRFFSAADYHVLTTSTSDEAIELCRNYDGTIHILVTDVDGDGACGWTLAEAAAKVRPGLMVLFLSAEDVATENPENPSSAVLIHNKPVASRSRTGFTPGMLAGVTQALHHRSQLQRRRN